MHQQAVGSQKVMTEYSRSAEQLMQIVSFRLGDEEFGLDILRVQEIIRMQELTHVPNSPDFVEGVINLRGSVIPIIALRTRFGLAEDDRDKQTRIIVIEVERMVLGFIVDSVSEVLRIPLSTVVPPPRLERIEREFVSGVCKLDNRLLMLLDLDQVLGVEVRSSAAATSRQQSQR